jgi:hypothetical protein
MSDIVSQQNYGDEKIGYLSFRGWRINMRGVLDMVNLREMLYTFTSGKELISDLKFLFDFLPRSSRSIWLTTQHLLNPNTAARMTS